MEIVRRLVALRRGPVTLAAVALLLAAGAAAGWAQGSFYMEVPKEGRIYVFNLMTVYEEWRKTGEMGKSITRVGAGPAGETLIFDSEEAIHLYNFRHGLPGEVLIKPEEKKPAMKVSWKDGKTSIETDKAALIVSNRVQFRYTHEQPDMGDSKGSFRVRRAKTKFEGWIYTKNLTYELQMNWADTSNLGTTQQKFLEDALLNYDLTRGRKALQIRGGQFKVPFGRQELTSSGSQQFVDRSIVSAEFARGRDIGLQIWGQTPKGTWEWRTGMFNGNGVNRSSNDNDRFQVNGRVTWQPFGDVKYSESDFESTDRPLLAVAAQYEQNNSQAPDPNGSQFDREVFGGDVVFKYKGLSLFGEYFRRVNEPENAAAADFDTAGWHAQAGWFVYKRFVEVAGRYAVIDPSDIAAANDHMIERGAALNWYINKHNLKLQSDYRQIENELTDRTNDEYRLQAQWIF
ncbi:MAG TPA: porin [Candidatus Polarisedimenticolia bacterium]|nr:porin [Candidatus Polarisedimenticolia bacterium]